MKDLKIVVLAGGISTERDVSLSSGKMIYEALKNLGHHPVLADVYLGISVPENEITSDIFYDTRDWGKDIKAVSKLNPDISLIKQSDRPGANGYFGPGILKLCSLCDVVFMGLHGEDGENGKVQAVFDLMGIKYTGSGPTGSALAMDKLLTKKLFYQAGIPTAEFLGSNVIGEELAPDKLKYPCVIKICHGGSSVGVYICNNAGEAESALNKAAAFKDDIMAESFVRGREFSVGVLMGKALPVIEIAPVSGFYDYENKYQPGATIETCPADIPDRIRDKMQRAAESAFNVLKIRDYGRVDFMLDDKENIYALEMNTLPGMTATSLLPQEARAQGIEFPRLCNMLVEAAMNRGND